MSVHVRRHRWPWFIAAQLVSEVVIAAPLIESEPNDTPATATALGSEPFAQGGMPDTSDVDVWLLADVPQGSLLFVAVDPKPSGVATANSLLEVLGDDGVTVLVTDDMDGYFFGSAIGGFAVPGGDIFLRISENDTIHRLSDYYLTVLYASLVRTRDEVEPNDTIGTATPIDERIMRGSVRTPDIDHYQFAAVAGDRVTVVIDDNPFGVSTNTDTEFHFLDTDGVSVLATGDNWGGARCQRRRGDYSTHHRNLLRARCQRHLW